jgi:hypothetical protein
MTLDAMSSCEDMGPVNEGSAAHEDVVELLLLQDGHLPRVFGCSEKKETCSYFNRKYRT